MRISDWSSDVCSSDLIARRGDPARGVPACVACHGLEQGPRFPHYPRLAGQQAWYLALQLRLLKAGERGARKSVGMGKSGSVRVVFVGRRLIKKKRHITDHTTTVDRSPNTTYPT